MGSFRFLFLEWSQCGNQISLLFPSNMCATFGAQLAVVVDVVLIVVVVVRVVWCIILIIFDFLTSFGRTFCSTFASVVDLSIVSRTTIRETCFAVGSSSSTVVGYLQWVCNADCGEHQDESDGLHFCTVWRVSVEWLSGNGPYRLLYPWRHLEFFQAGGGVAGWCTTGPLHWATMGSDRGVILRLVCWYMKIQPTLTSILELSTYRELSRRQQWGNYHWDITSWATVLNI